MNTYIRADWTVDRELGLSLTLDGWSNVAALKAVRPIRLIRLTDKFPISFEGRRHGDGNALELYAHDMHHVETVWFPSKDTRFIDLTLQACYIYKHFLGECQRRGNIK